jgi:hypothetical protein
VHSNLDTFKVTLRSILLTFGGNQQDGLSSLQFCMFRLSTVEDDTSRWLRNAYTRVDMSLNQQSNCFTSTSPERAMCYLGDAYTINRLHATNLSSLRTFTASRLVDVS